PPPPAQADLAARLDGHPELAVAAAGVQVARADADLAREAYKSDWNVDVSYGLRGADRSDFLSVMVGVDLPLFTTNRQDRRLAARLAGVARAEQMAADRRLALKAELAAAFADWQAATARLARYDRDILPLAERRAESALIAYGTDRASYGRVLEARRAVLEARLQRLAQHVAQVRAAVQLRYFGE
ncbi:MAG TPA: TolC family protein, partial [Thiobacillaceae bacterium]|nr:TolC family protein [Thiobacillaceae bacterium]